MPTTKAKSRKSQKTTAPDKAPAIQLPKGTPLVVAALSGAVLGLSAPGFNQWYIAWVGLAPLLLLCVSAKGLGQAFGRGLLFGTTYNLVYLNWYLQLHPLKWLGFNDFESILLSTAAWFCVAFHQGLITALLTAAMRCLPLTGSFAPDMGQKKWLLPAPIVIPLLWVLVQNKVCNAPDLLGVPWTMLEYSQYKQIAFIQMASVIGGIGIGALIVLANTVIASLIATATQRPSFKTLACPSGSQAISQVLGVGLCIALGVAWGFSHLSSQPQGRNPVSVVQGNINIEMEKRTHAYTLGQLTAHYQKLISSTPPGVCILTESALPTYLKEERQLLQVLADLSRNGKRQLVLGSLDHDFDGRPYNSAFGMDSTGHLYDVVYHKRYLVPFGEYMPNWVSYFPEWIRRLTSTPAGTGFNSGKRPVVLDLDGRKVAPLICFETMSPELVVSSVRNGGELVVNLSDLAWFHNSMCGDQMIAFSCLRAVENERCFVFAANTGPSAIIDTSGRITARSKLSHNAVLCGNVRFNSEKTPFTQWFH